MLKIFAGIEGDPNEVRMDVEVTRRMSVRPTLDSIGFSTMILDGNKN